MIELSVLKNELGLFEADATPTLPPLRVTRQKSDRDDLEYELRRAFEELVGEIVASELKNEF